MWNRLKKIQYFYLSKYLIERDGTGRTDVLASCSWAVFVGGWNQAKCKSKQEKDREEPVRRARQARGWQAKVSKRHAKPIFYFLACTPWLSTMNNALWFVVPTLLIQKSSAFLLGSPIGRPHTAMMSSSESPQAGASVADVNMESTYNSLVDRLISRYEKQSAANELKNNQLFVGKISSFSALVELLYFSSNNADSFVSRICPCCSMSSITL